MTEESSTPERFNISPTRGPRLKFTGRKIAGTEWETRGRDPMHVEIEVFETQGGALIASRITQPAMREGFVDVQALVVEPSDDEQAMHFAVLDFFEWGDYARSMAHKQLKWRLTMDVA